METIKLEAAARSARLRVEMALAVILCLLMVGPARGASNVKFEISFPADVHSQSITGRVFVMLSRQPDPEPRLEVGGWQDPPPLFGVDVNQLRPGAVTVIDGRTLGYPLRSLAQIPAGDYYVQALVNVYSEFHRSDGHVIWAHMDRWEGQQFNRSPGNLYSAVERVHLDPRTGYDVKLTLSKEIPPIKERPDTAWVKHIKIESKLLTKFWGRPMYLGATVLLPKGYDAHPDARYPVVYEQDHFTLAAPFNFNASPSARASRREFYDAWNSDHFPRVIAVRFQHPTPYFDDSYAVNSANNGPYGDAIMTELIPYVEEHFRILRRPYARVLWGGSTGGWESLALEIYHPDFFGGTWTFFPDPVDFHRYDLVNIYDDDNAFVAPGHEWMFPERYLMRDGDGQPEVTVRQFSQLEATLGTHGRSGQQLEAWEAVYGPVGADGYPKPLWDKRTGKIDHDVARYMRDHGYDLRDYLESNWPKIGPQLVGKLHFYCGDMDNYYLNLAVYLLEDFLEDTKNPYYAGSFEYGRPMKGHGWMPMSPAELVRMMAEQIKKDAPAGENTGQWNY
ncbi:MAG TPA: alpha/beta hydrolase-fold protein [Terriglobia bacterium]|nr:alpha/beta hydrolase-fold protein [Terriglobia bacterium]